MKLIRQYDAKQNSLYFLFWPVWLLRYLIVERFHPAEVYHPVWCPLDDKIPFQEVFLIPYVLWYFCIIGVHLWLFLRNDPAYRWYSRYLIFTMVISTVVFLLYPSCQNLRLTEFPRKNPLTAAVDLLYRMDTNTNVCPSEHVIGAFGFFMAVLHMGIEKPVWIVLAGVGAFLSAVSTVFLKQHSVVDVVVALLVCTVAMIFSFGMGFVKRNIFSGRS